MTIEMLADQMKHLKTPIDEMAAATKLSALIGGYLKNIDDYPETEKQAYHEDFVCDLNILYVFAVTFRKIVFIKATLPWLAQLQKNLTHHPIINVTENDQWLEEQCYKDDIYHLVQRSKSLKAKEKKEIIQAAAFIGKALRKDAKYTNTTLKAVIQGRKLYWQQRKKMGVESNFPKEKQAIEKLMQSVQVRLPSSASPEACSP